VEFLVDGETDLFGGTDQKNKGGGNGELTKNLQRRDPLNFNFRSVEGKIVRDLGIERRVRAVILVGERRTGELRLAQEIWAILRDQSAEMQQSLRDRTDEDSRKKKEENSSFRWRERK